MRNNWFRKQTCPYCKKLRLLNHEFYCKFGVYDLDHTKNKSIKRLRELKNAE